MVQEMALRLQPEQMHVHTPQSPCPTVGQQQSHSSVACTAHVRRVAYHTAALLQSIRRVMVTTLSERLAHACAAHAAFASQADAVL